MKSQYLISLWEQDRSEPLVSQIPQSLLTECLDAQPTIGTSIHTKHGRRFRVLRKNQGKYSALAYSENADRLKSKKVLESDLDTFLAAAPTIDAAIQRAEGRTRRLLHNLKSLTAKTSQEVFAIGLQHRLIGNPREVVPYLASEIRDNIDGTARALLEILKHQAAQKAEYTAFDRLSGKLDRAKIEPHNVHQVLMNVFYLFFGEFIGKKVKAEVEPTHTQAKFDYDSVHVCIYYLVENAAKYTRQNSSFSVSTTEDGAGNVDIRFTMESLVIKQDEQQLIFEEGYSGTSAVESNLNGAGLGLYLARAMARINSGNLNVIAGRSMLGNKYTRNTFILTLPTA